MKTQSIQQEILVITGNNFSSRQWAEKNPKDYSKLSSAEYLENACWNGLLNEMLPEVIQKPPKGKKLFLWYVRNCKSFLGIELSESTPTIEEEFSINPYVFVPTEVMN